MPDIGSNIINPPNHPVSRIENRWDALPDKNPHEIDIDRASAEYSSYLNARQQFFHQPFRLPLSTSDSRIQLPIKLAGDQSHDFCWKTCALYCTVQSEPLGIRPGIFDLLHAFYRLWFKGDGTNVSWGNFFAKMIAAWPESEGGEGRLPMLRNDELDIPHLIAVHQNLCAAVKAKQDNPAAADLYPSHQKAHHNYIFQPFFEKVFLVMDTVSWDWEGFLLVRSDQARPLRLECNNFDVLQPSFREGDQGSVMRLRIEDAVRLVSDMKAREDEIARWPMLGSRVGMVKDESVRDVVYEEEM